MTDSREAHNPTDEQREAARQETRERMIRTAPATRFMDNEFENFSTDLFEKVESRFPDMSRDDMRFAVGQIFTDLCDTYEDWNEENEDG